MKFLRLGIVLSLLLSALPARAQDRYSYQCDDGKTFQVEYLNDRSARVTLDNAAPVTLTTVATATGVRYGNDQIRLYTKGNQAFLTEGGRTTYSNCVGRAVATQDRRAAGSTAGSTSGSSTTAAPTRPVQPVRGMW